MTYGPRKPPRLPTALISAMPPAAALPVSMAVGNAQNVGAIPEAAIWAMIMAIIISTGSLNTKQDVKAAALIRQAAAQCRLRSPVRSEFQPHKISAAIPKRYGNA